VLGAGAGLLSGRRGLPAAAWIAPLLAVIAGLGLAAAAPGYVERHARTFGYPGYPYLYGALRQQPGYDEDSRPVAMGPYTFAPVGGDRLRHQVSLVPYSEPCAAVRARARSGWLIVVRIDDPANVYWPGSRRLQACMKGTKPRAEIPGYYLFGPG